METTRYALHLFLGFFLTEARASPGLKFLKKVGFGEFSDLPGFFGLVDLNAQGFEMSQSLYDKYGGFSAVSKIVHEFYRRVQESDLLIPYFSNADMDRLINHQIRFFSTLMGGPVIYDVAQIDEIHKRLNISPVAFDEVLDLLQESLEDSGVAVEDSEAVLEELRDYRARIVAA
ncbi:MAG: group I truncated hemoglobin [Methylococcales bacterium]